MIRLHKKEKRYRRHRRVRVKIKGKAQQPRLCVFRSAKHICAQLIDDEKGKTILSASDLELKKPKIHIKSVASLPVIVKQLSKNKETKAEKRKVNRMGKIAIAYEVGKLIAQKALEKEIKKVVFDRGGYKYHGRIQAVAEGAREAGLEF